MQRSLVQQPESKVDLRGDGTRQYETRTPHPQHSPVRTWNERPHAFVWSNESNPALLLLLARADHEAILGVGNRQDCKHSFALVYVRQATTKSTISQWSMRRTLQATKQIEKRRLARSEWYTYAHGTE